MRRDAVLLAEIVTAVRRILELAAGQSAGEIEVAPDRRDSLLWNFTVLGEAVSQLSAGLKADHPTVPWTDASRLRNRVVHGYWSVDFEVLIATARDDLPSFLGGVESVLASLVENAG
ncbi:unannotated protein [freshwater metagenome]|uniref:Unannotated protein n=1 Tax=freshwater metagenome TaxID=449393 RepID=A0A6J7G1N4_9ZZZZ|nr:DUF86 domain-containing protein [Actinomycetota bacterium]